jgi:hypothetical protein
MRSRCFAVVLATATVLAPACVSAKSGYVRPPPVHVTAAIPPVMLHSLPHISTHEALGGCGTHRHYNPETQKCRGPADF